MTNGEKLIEIFPNNTHITLKRTTQFAINPMTINQQMIVVDNDFWNAEYKELVIRDNEVKDELEPTTKKDCNTCTHSNEIDGSDCYECVKDMCNNYDPTTKNDLEVDCIDRKMALDTIQMKWKKCSNANDAMQESIDAIREMPSVTPQEPRWIPVSEYLPVTNDEVLVTYIVNGNTKKRYVETANCFDGEWSSVNDEYRIPNTKIEIIAWCEMPQPYREVEE